MSDLPAWIDSLVSGVAAMFGLHSWRVLVHSDKSPSRPDGHESADGLASMKSDYLEAQLFFDRDLKPDTYGYEVVVHEVLHLVFLDMRNTVHDISQFVFDEDQRGTLFSIYERVEEQTITRLARGMARQFDFKQWLNGDSEDAHE